MLICPLCDTLLESVRDLQAHGRLYHINLLGNFACRQANCNSHTLYTWDSFVRHSKNHMLQQGGLNVVPGDIFQNGERNEMAIDHDDVANYVEEGDGDGVNHDDGGDNRNDRFSLDFFVNNLYSDVKFFVASLYAHPNSSRKLVDTVLKSTSSMIASSVKLLKENVFHLLSTCDGDENFPDLSYKINQMFSVLEDPFESMKTELKRLSSLEGTGCLIKPEAFVMGYEEKYVNTENGVNLVHKAVFGQFIPLRKVLKTFLELPGMFDAILEFINKLHHDTSGKISHLIQGELWQHLSQNDGDKLYLPINLHFDDYEPDNALGSHNTAHSLGALYANLACLPSEDQSSTLNMFLCSVFETKHRKTYGNEVTFQPVIDELTFLEEEGVTLFIENVPKLVFFRLCCIKGDNAGIHSVQGITDGFGANFYCRFCKMHRNDMRLFCRKVPDVLMRTVANYNDDVALDDLYVTGIKENCVWNNLPSYHCISNSSCDFMHDFPEGVIKYDLCNILHNLISVRGYFTLETLCERIDGFDYGPADKVNKPPTFNFSHQRLANCSLNLSAGEMLCLVRYLGQIVGDLVPEGNASWRLYLILVNIIEVVLCPFVSPGIDIYFRTLVCEHHELYIYLFGALKPKHHFLLHYAMLMRRYGPLAALSAFTLERFHRLGKMYAKACHSRVNFPFSVALKYQLSLCNRLLKLSNKSLDAVRPKTCPIQSLDQYEYFDTLLNYPPQQIVNTTESVTVFGTKYCCGMFLVVSVSEILPSFGEILHILIHDDSVTFVVKVKLTLTRSEHLNAFVIDDSDDFVCVQQKNLLYFNPLYCRTDVNGRRLVTLKHAL